MISVMRKTYDAAFKDKAAFEAARGGEDDRPDRERVQRPVNGHRKITPSSAFCWTSGSRMSPRLVLFSEPIRVALDVDRGRFQIA